LDLGGIQRARGGKARLHAPLVTSSGSHRRARCGSRVISEVLLGQHAPH
jgi:hypothetical protein